MPYYDEEGNEVADLIPAAQVEDLKKSLEEKEREIKEKEEKLSKYQDKEFNFSKFRELEKKEKDEMLKNFSEKEKIMIEQLEQVASRQSDLEKRLLGSYEEEALSSIAGNDEEFRNKIKEAAKEFKTEPKNKEEAEQLYRKAYVLVKEMGNNGGNSLNRFMPISTPPDQNNKKSIIDTPEGKEKFAQWFPNSALTAEIKKSNK